MAKIPDRVKILIDKYLHLLAVNNIPIKSAFLFGSFAKGNPREYSDIDLALVSDVFEGKRIIDKNKIRRITLSVSSDLEVFPFNPQDFNTENPFAREIIETGIRII